MFRVLVVVAFVIASIPALAQDDQKVWTGEASASISNQTGTTSSFSGTADAKATRTWEKDEATARLTATYGTAKQRARTKRRIRTIRPYLVSGSTASPSGYLALC